MGKRCRSANSNPATGKKFDMRSVAARAGVSTATVSRTINNVPSVDAALAKRVWEAIKELNYRPNTSARALVSGRSGLLGLIVSEITNPFFPELIQSFEHIAVRRGYEILIASTSYDPQKMNDCVRRMLERSVDGIAVMTFGMEEPLLGELAAHHFPLVSVDAGIKSTRVATLAIDYHQGVRQAVQHLAALGHRDMAFISGPMHLHSSKARQLAFLESMREIGAPVKGSWVREGNHRLEGGTACMHAILDTGDVPTAVLCSNDVTAIGVLHALAASGLRVPQDMSVVGFDDIQMARFTVPPLTTIRMSPDDLTSAAVDSLIAQIGAAEGESIALPKEIKTNLVVRQTTNFRDKSMQAFAPGPSDLHMPHKTASRVKQ